jgi:threonine synthase
VNHTPTVADSPVMYDRSGGQYLVTDRRWRGDDGSPLGLSALPGIAREQIDTGERSLWRYDAVIPVDRHHRVSLGEGCTPMLPMECDGRRVHFKLEWFNPTSRTAG